MLAFVSQLLNSVLVLLLVNAQSSIASAAINGALNSGSASKYTSWWVEHVLRAGAVQGSRKCFARQRLNNAPKAA